MSTSSGVGWPRSMYHFRALIFDSASCLSRFGSCPDNSRYYKSRYRQRCYRTHYRVKRVTRYRVSFPMRCQPVQHSANDSRPAKSRANFPTREKSGPVKTNRGPVSFTVTPPDDPTITPISPGGCSAFEVYNARCGQPVEFVVAGQWRKFGESGAPKRRFKTSTHWSHADLLCSKHYRIWREQFCKIQRLIGRGRRASRPPSQSRRR